MYGKTVTSVAPPSTQLENPVAMFGSASSMCAYRTTTSDPATTALAGNAAGGAAVETDAAAALGSGIGLGDVQLTVGTGAQVLRLLATPASRADAGVNLYRSATPDGWYQMGATLSAGLSLNWVREVMNASWAELYASAGRPGRPHDPIFVPHLSGERTPYCDPALRGSWTALSLADDRTSLLRGALEGRQVAR